MNGGATWVALNIHDAPASIRPISCADVTHCVAVGYITYLEANGRTIDGPIESVATSDGGLTWYTAPVGQKSYSGSISCPTVNNCLLVSPSENPALIGTVYSTADGGHTWRTADSLPDNAVTTLDMVSCASPTVCITSGGTTGPAPDQTPEAILYRSDDTGGHWQVIHQAHP